MKIFEKSQEKELRHISEYILSKDQEIIKLGIECLRKSNIYKNLRPISLFYYPSGSYSKIRTSTFLNSSFRILMSSESNPYIKGTVRKKLSQMFSRLLGDDVRKYFRREFINTSKIL